jgi:serralysin
MADIVGTPGPDTLTGTTGNDTINGLGGNDTISDGDGVDIVDGGDGDDRIIDGPGMDTLRGGAGFDTFELSDANTLIDGGLNYGRVTINLLFAGASFRSAPPSSFRRGPNGVVSVTQNAGNQTLYNITTYETIRETTVGGAYTTNHLLDVKDDIGSDGDSDLLYFSRTAGELGYGSLFAANTLVTNVIENMDFTNWVVQGVGYVRISGSSDFRVQPDPDFIIKNVVTGEFFCNFYSQRAFPDRYSFNSFGVTDINLDVATMADTNGDLVDEIIWRDRRDGTVTISKIDSNYQQISSSSFGALGTQWQVAGASDFDNDGDEDILLRNDQNGHVYIYYMQEGAKSGSASVNVFGANWIVQGVGDFNNDNIADIALKNTTTGQFYLLLMDAAGSYTGSNLGIIGTDWNIAKTGDYNGDGTDDLLWRNANTNQIYMWAMQDGHQAATGSEPYGFLTADQIII